MRLEHYTIVTTSGTHFENAKLQMKEKVITMSKQGWKLQGGASVKVKRYKTMVWYDIYQTMIPGKQKLKDYNIVSLSAFCDSLPNVVNQMEISVKNLCERMWKIQGGASVNVEFIHGQSDCPVYDIYQTVIQ